MTRTETEMGMPQAPKDLQNLQPNPTSVRSVWTLLQTVSLSPVGFPYSQHMMMGACFLGSGDIKGNRYLTGLWASWWWNSLINE